MSQTAVITGVATGIGREVALALAAAGFRALTLLDLDAPGLQQTAQTIRAQHPNVSVSTHVVDVRDSEAQQAVIDSHVEQHGSIDVVVLNAGVGERGDVFAADNLSWQTTLDVDLTAVLHGIRQTVLAAGRHGRSSTIISIASAGGVFPMPVAPVYAASKAGVVHFTRSAGSSLARKGIRLMAVCPEFVDTPLVRTVMAADPAQAKRLLGSLDIALLPPAAVARAVVQLLQPEHKSGTVLLLRQDGSVQFPFAGAAPGKGAHSSPGATSLPARTRTGSEQGAYKQWAAAGLPATYSKVQVHTLTSDFARATRVVAVPLAPLLRPPPGQLLLRRTFVGINASDVNYSAGRYHSSVADAKAKLPFDAGFESVGVVVAAGEGVKGFVQGDAVATMSYDGFAEFVLAPAAQALAVPRPSPEMVALLTSGLTASIALQEAARLQPGETVLVTAAAGGTGQFAVQLAKLAGCHVIATAGGPDKVALLQRLGADRVVDYKQERLKDVLKAEYPKGVDVVYESVGGEMFADALSGLAQRGRLLVIGMMSSYQEGWPVSSLPGIPEKLLWKSASMIGFFLLRYASHFKAHLAHLVSLVEAGKLQVAIDARQFVGVESVQGAVAYLQSGKSIGKVVVQLAKELPPGLHGSAPALIGSSKLQLHSTKTTCRRVARVQQALAFHRP